MWKASKEMQEINTTHFMLKKRKKIQSEIREIKKVYENILKAS